MGIPWSVAVPPEVYCEYAGVRLRDFYLNPEKRVEGIIEGGRRLHELYGLPLPRYVSIDLPYTDISVFGLDTEFPEDGIPMPRGHLFNSIDDAASATVPEDLSQSGYIPKILQDFEWLRKNAPAGISTGFSLGGARGPFTTAVLLRGIGLFEEVYTAPEKVHRFLELITETSIRLLVLHRRLCGIANEKFESIGFTDDYGGLLSPKLYREFSCRYMRMMVDRLGATRVSLHSETLRPGHLKYFAEVGITSFDAGTGSGLTITDMKQALDIPFMLQMKTVEDMLFGTPQSIKAKYRQMVEEGATQMMVELCRGVPRENIYAFIEVAREYE